ncbi:MAG: peptide chain release factor N(5)-glutamine methyltransferase [Myxococcota bacterium]|nr:peptide chain release factor N(5)-glutamine methyltransferase [Myxococcota bacterium]
MSKEKSWTILELLEWTTEHFAQRGIEAAKLDAECLLAHALGTKRLQLYVDFEKTPEIEERARFRELVVRRAAERVPVSQLIGKKEFWSLELDVSGDVLSPRPETETLVEAALARLPDPRGQYRILDLGTGSGAIALALSSERSEALVTATDISPEALQIASSNADKLHLSERLRFLEGDLLGAVPGEQFDLVVSNPPYVARRDADSLPPELAHEPEVALYGGEDGFAVSSRLVAEVRGALVPEGVFAIEIAPGQAERVAEECRKAGLEEIEVLRDLAKRPRVVAARKPAEPARDERK